MNYAQLVTAIQDECEYSETDFVNNIPNFTKRAEERILRDIDLPAFRTTSTAISTVVGQKYLTPPTGYLYPHYLIVNDLLLMPKQVDWIIEAYGSASGAPKCYATVDETKLLLGPKPDAIYTTEIAYCRLPESIVTASTTWLGDNAHRALLGAALVEAAIFMRQDQDVVQMRELSYQDALKGLTLFGELRVKKDDFKERDKRPNDE